MDWSWLPWVHGVGTVELGLLGRLALAGLLGGVVGLEREITGKPAGFRTNLLICVGATLLTDLSLLVAAHADPTTTRADPGRIAAQIVSGIGFLGAGTILQARGSVVGLTTAATLWVVAAIGIAVGAHAYFAAIGTTVLVVAVLLILGKVEVRLFRAGHERSVQVTVELDLWAFDRVQDLVEAEEGELLSVEVSPDRRRCTASFIVQAPRKTHRRVLDRLLKEAGVRTVREG